MVNHKFAVRKLKQITVDARGFTLVEFVISLFLFTMVLMGLFNLLSVNMLGLKLSKDQQALENIAIAQLQELITTTKCIPLDPLLEVCVGDCPAKYRETDFEGRSITSQWKTYEENVTGSESVKTYRIEMFVYFTNKPVTTKKYVATKICYQQ
ncbi:prepilin-type N-terminal cleavage/methylation domain-containing protein [bacterium]|nr:prepilin-type N-terminal cleavage/methylation domain-containing protein [bacterium]MCI0601956.1 prepilin-type N-terminal cleavage/methylation domain-containing protein [bacterium]